MGWLFVWSLFFVAAGAAFLFFTPLRQSLKTDPDEVARTVKPRTVVFVALGFGIPFWIVSLPIFFLLAYRSYVEGAPAPGPAGTDAAAVAAARVVDRMAALDALHASCRSGALTPAEFDAEKRRLLAAEMPGPTASPVA